MELEREGGTDPGRDGFESVLAACETEAQAYGERPVKQAQDAARAFRMLSRDGN